MIVYSIDMSVDFESLLYRFTSRQSAVARHLVCLTPKVSYIDILTLQSTSIRSLVEENQVSNGGGEYRRQ